MVRRNTQESGINIQEDLKILEGLPKTTASTDAIDFLETNKKKLTFLSPSLKIEFEELLQLKQNDNPLFFRNKSSVRNKITAEFNEYLLNFANNNVNKVKKNVTQNKAKSNSNNNGMSFKKTNITPTAVVQKITQSGKNIKNLNVELDVYKLYLDYTNKNDANLTALITSLENYRKSPYYDENADKYLIAIQGIRTIISDIINQKTSNHDSVILDSKKELDALIADFDIRVKSGEKNDLKLISKFGKSSRTIGKYYPGNILNEDPEVLIARDKIATIYGMKSNEAVKNAMGNLSLKQKSYITWDDEDANTIVSNLVKEGVIQDAQKFKQDYQLESEELLDDMFESLKSQINSDVTFITLPDKSIVPFTDILSKNKALASNLLLLKAIYEDPNGAELTVDKTSRFIKLLYNSYSSAGHFIEGETAVFVLVPISTLIMTGMSLHSQERILVPLRNSGYKILVDEYSALIKAGDNEKITAFKKANEKKITKIESIYEKIEFRQNVIDMLLSENSDKPKVGDKIKSYGVDNIYSPISDKLFFANLYRVEMDNAGKNVFKRVNQGARFMETLDTYAGRPLFRDFQGANNSSTFVGEGWPMRDDNGVINTREQIEKQKTGIKSYQEYYQNKYDIKFFFDINSNKMLGGVKKQLNDFFDKERQRPGVDKENFQIQAKKLVDTLNSLTNQSAKSELSTFKDKLSGELQDMIEKSVSSASDFNSTIEEMIDKIGTQSVGGETPADGKGLIGHLEKLEAIQKKYYAATKGEYLVLAGGTNHSIDAMNMEKIVDEAQEKLNKYELVKKLKQVSGDFEGDVKKVLTDKVDGFDTVDEHTKTKWISVINELIGMEGKIDKNDDFSKIYKNVVKQVLTNNNPDRILGRLSEISGEITNSKKITKTGIKEIDNEMENKVKDILLKEGDSERMGVIIKNQKQLGNIKQIGDIDIKNAAEKILVANYFDREIKDIDKFIVKFEELKVLIPNHELQGVKNLEAQLTAMLEKFDIGGLNALEKQMEKLEASADKAKADGFKEKELDIQREAANNASGEKVVINMPGANEGGLDTEKTQFDIQEQKIRFEEIRTSSKYLNNRRNLSVNGIGVSVDVTTSTGIVRIGFYYGNQNAESIMTQLSQVNDKTTKEDVLKILGVEEVPKKKKTRASMARANKVIIENMKIDTVNINIILQEAQQKGLQEKEVNNLRNILEQGDINKAEQATKKMGLYNTFKNIISKISKT